MSRIGLLGGTFDPPHWGHLWLAESARVQLGLDRVLFLPAGEPVHKLGKVITAVSHRLQMISLAIQDNPNFVLDTTDSTRPAPHTTVTLLPLLQEKYPDAAFWLLIGGDSLRDLPTWVEPARLITQCRLGVLPRPGATIAWETLETAVPGIKTAVDLLDGPTLSISATTIRAWIKDGHEATYLLPTAVSRYIQQNKLYTD
ncbi:MAG: nicotinate (nicotinamide) nucleotide adenylyltransferase [Ardenticatenaceae bacterium]|nr:nicotinate-nucleotide adenylyltransferase [Anaerolineales bacterium]MCB8940308.1 nicotinate (nicotinamide) nucleotide adenylyltransferase [Ardenticatenaceae bacterium]MCB8973324.1 nicotinate (nicotinamide) nucleotide adenylyltransferase [Ardenticatenaceae bacterium]